MNGVFIFIVMVLLIGIIFVVPIFFWIRRYWRIEFKHTTDVQLNQDPDLLHWLEYYLSLIVKGKWGVKRNHRTINTDNMSIIDRPEASIKSHEQVEEHQGNRPESELLTHPSKVHLAFDLPPGARVQVVVENISNTANHTIEAIIVEAERLDTGEPVSVDVNPSGEIIPAIDLDESRRKDVEQKISLKAIVGRLRISLSHLDIILFLVSLSVYLITRLVGLDQFPIYFFTDEAIHTILADEMVKNGFRYNGIFLPTYFPVGASFGLNSISVYLQVLPLLIFGKSVFFTRAVSVIITLLGAIAVGLILKNFLHAKYWWSGVLILSITPVWFLHSRTAFEYLEMASFYAIFIYFYLCYRLKSPKYLFITIFLGACVFYTHGLGAILIGITALLLFLFDIPYHWQNRKIILLGLILILLFALPYLRFTRSYPGILEEQLRMRGSYLLDQNMKTFQKIGQFIQEYLFAFSPKFWFLPDNGRDIYRHMMKGYGNISWISLPFILYGIYLFLRKFRSPAHRVVVISLMASPLGAASAQISGLRVIWMIIPVTIIASYGLSEVLRNLEGKRLTYPALAISLCVILCSINAYILRDTLVNGPLWFTDYGLYGLQYGAKQVFGEAIPKLLDENPSTQIIVTPTWANGTDNFASFFLTPEQQKRVRLDSINAFLYEKLPVDDNLILVLTKPEYEQAVSSSKFKDIPVIQILKYPDGSAGFYFVNLIYSDTADEIFAAEKLARSQPVESDVIINGQTVRVRYSQIDMGQPQALFDNDVHTLMRGLEANPYIIDFFFPESRAVNELLADFANMDFSLKIELFEEIDGSPVVYETTIRNPVGDPHVEITFDRGPSKVSRVRISVLHLTAGEKAHIHIRELMFIP